MSVALPPLSLITGGARSGKSRYAEWLMHQAAGDDGHVTYVATLAPGDDEMVTRIAYHRTRRPATWLTLEAPHDLAGALSGARPGAVLIDCLSGWVANRQLAAPENAKPERTIDGILSALEVVLRAARDHDGPVVVVSNEVGGGVVPAFETGRLYRDALGLCNQITADTADAVAWVVVGLPQLLKGTLPTTTG